MRRTAEDSEQTRLSLVDAAMRVFMDKGYADARIEDIAEAAGLTRGAFYHHFESKKAVFLALLHERYEPYAGVLFPEPSPDKSLPILKELEMYFARFLERLASDRGLRDIFFLVSYKTGFVQDLRDGIGEKAARIGEQVAWIRRRLESAALRGELREGTDPAAAAFLLYGSLWGLSEHWVLDPSVFDLGAGAAILARMMVAPLEKT